MKATYLYYEGGNEYTSVQVPYAGNNLQNVGTLPENPTREGYTFVDWYYKAANGTENKFTAATAVNDDMTVYAKWITNPTIVVTGANLPVGYTEGSVSVTVTPAAGQVINRYDWYDNNTINSNDGSNNRVKEKTQTLHSQATTFLREKKGERRIIITAELG